jgi:hypothetical protein
MNLDFCCRGCGWFCQASVPRSIVAFVVALVFVVLLCYCLGCPTPTVLGCLLTRCSVLSGMPLRHTCRCICVQIPRHC